METQHLISNKEFMDKFIALANHSYQSYGTYEDVYYGYEDELSDDVILELLDYCEDNNLLEV